MLSSSSLKSIIGFSVLILFTGILMSSSCAKNCEYGFKFQQDIMVSPGSDSIHVGDTFYISIKNPTNMLNLKENVLNELKDYPPIIKLNMYHLTSKDSNKRVSHTVDGRMDFLLPRANSDFDYFDINSKMQDWGISGKIINYDIVNDSFIYKAAFIPKDTGIYLFMFIDVNVGFGASNSSASVETKCSKRWYGTSYYVNQGDCNPYLLDCMGITCYISQGYLKDYEKHNFEHGVWSFVVLPKDTMP